MVCQNVKRPPFGGLFLSAGISYAMTSRANLGEEPVISPGGADTGESSLTEIERPGEKASYADFSGGGRGYAAAELVPPTPYFLAQT